MASDSNASPAEVPAEPVAQPRLTVRLMSFPESNGKRNWTALLVRADEWDGLLGNCGGITINRGELWNRVAYEAERAKLLIGERDTEPDILDYGDDIKTPEQWVGEVRGGRPVRAASPSVPQAVPRAAIDAAVAAERERWRPFAKHRNDATVMCETLRHSDYRCTCGLVALQHPMMSADGGRDIPL